MKRCALYMRVSTVDQHPESQLYDLRSLAAQRGFHIVAEYTDRISGAKPKRPGLDELMYNARQGKFDVVLVWAFDRMARSVRHFLELIDELNHRNIEFVSFRENIDTGGALGRAMIIIVGAIAELERNLIIERVRAGMRRAKLEGRRIGRTPLPVDRPAVGSRSPPRHEPHRGGEGARHQPCPGQQDHAGRERRWPRRVPAGAFANTRKQATGIGRLS